MWKYLALFFLSLALLLPAQSQAQGVRQYANRADAFFGDVYLGVKYGEISAADDDSDLPEDGSDIRNAGIAFGRLVNDYVGWEFEYTSTVSKDDFTVDGVDYGDLEAETLGIFLVAKSRGDVYVKGRVGWMRVTQEFDPFDETNAYGGAYGVGAGVKFGEYGAVELEYTRHPSAEYKINVPPVGEVEFDVYTDLLTIGYVLSFE